MTDTPETVSSRNNCMMLLAMLLAQQTTLVVYLPLSLFPRAYIFTALLWMRKHMAPIWSKMHPEGTNKLYYPHRSQSWKDRAHENPKPIQMCAIRGASKIFPELVCARGAQAETRARKDKKTETMTMRESNSPGTFNLNFAENVS